jgi:macrodomain Ter protein organizer (MatP/YcbG family)
MERYFDVRDREDRRNRRFFAKHGAVRTQSITLAHRAWRRIRPRLPARIADRLGVVARRLG